MCVFSYDLLLLELDPMTLIHELVVDILKIYLHTKNEVYRSRLSKVTAQKTTDTGVASMMQEEAVVFGNIKMNALHL